MIIKYIVLAFFGLVGFFILIDVLKAIIDKLKYDNYKYVEPSESETYSEAWKKNSRTSYLSQENMNYVNWTKRSKSSKIDNYEEKEISKANDYLNYKKSGLSYNNYIIKAKYKETNRKRTLKKAYHKSIPESYIRSELLKSGFSEPIEIHLAENEPPTERQIVYAKSLKIPIRQGLCKQDVSSLISRVTDHSSSPKQGLIDFADQEHLMFSYCVGKKELYDIVFAQLNDTKRIAFFVFSVYRYLYNDREPNLNNSIHRSIFFNFANSHINDYKFTKSMNNYNGQDLRFFGSVNISTPEGRRSITGGSKNTYAYKEASQFLKIHFGEPKPINSADWI